MRQYAASSRCLATYSCLICRSSVTRISRGDAKSHNAVCKKPQCLLCLMLINNSLAARCAECSCGLSRLVLLTHTYSPCSIEGSVCCRPNGSTLFRNANLRKQGWAVLVIPWFEWHYCTAKSDYLASKLLALLTPHFQQPQACHEPHQTA